MEAKVDPERNDAWTAITMAALTHKLSNTPKHQRKWDEVGILTDKQRLMGREKDGQRMITGAQTTNRIGLGNLQCLRSIKI